MLLNTCHRKTPTHINNAFWMEGFHKKRKKRIMVPNQIIHLDQAFWWKMKRKLQKIEFFFFYWLFTFLISPFLARECKECPKTPHKQHPIRISPYNNKHIIILLWMRLSFTNLVVGLQQWLHFWWWKEKILMSVAELSSSPSYFNG